MSDVTHILGQIESGHGEAAENLLPLVYDEHRTLAAAKMTKQHPGQTLQATALVHDAYVRRADVDKAQPGIRVATAFPLLPRPCDGSWWKTPGVRSERGSVVIGVASIWEICRQPRG